MRAPVTLAAVVVAADVAVAPTVAALLLSVAAVGVIVKARVMSTAPTVSYHASRK